MLNISLKRINDKLYQEKYSSFILLKDRNVSSALIKIMTILMIGLVLSTLLPWTQNIRSKGSVTTLNPDDRPQSVQSIIGGRIEKWYVKEGQIVKKGDTIIQVSESKQEYFDPNILENTNEQIIAKAASSEAYITKAENLQDQYLALINSRDIKLEQNKIKVQQTLLKIQSDSIDLVATITKRDIAKNQLDRIQKLYDEGIKSLTDLEAKRLSLQESEAKVIAIQNKLNTNSNELLNLKANIIAINNEYQDKILKSKSERMTALSSKYDADASRNKLQSQYNAYEQRQKNYFILSPINGTIMEAISTGIGEVIKEGEDIVTIIPSKYDLAIEMYVLPRDMPLIVKGQHVRVQFDGWPAIVFSGWPNNSYGTFGGSIVAIENSISKNGKYRILVAPDSEEPWPNEVRVGGGANTITLLKDVRLGYEIWRQLNGFPADYYKPDETMDIKTKAPLKKVK